MSGSSDTRDGITLTCTPGKEGETVVFDYTVANASGATAYVSDAGIRVDPAARTAAADRDDVAVWLSGDRYATVLKGVAELPTDRDIPGVVMPLMRRLAPGERIAHKLVLALPLAEHSPYFGLGHVRDYRLTDIEGVRFAVDVLPAAPAGLDPEAVPFAEGYYDIGVRGTGPLLRRLVCSFRARGLHLMVRTDAYPRPD